MADQAALSAKIDKIAANLAAKIEEVTAALEAKVPPAIDLSPELAKLKAINDAITGISVSVGADVEPEAEAEEPDEELTEILEPGFVVVDGEPAPEIE